MMRNVSAYARVKHENVALRDLLADVAASGVSYDEPRCGYVEVQIDRETWQALADFKRVRVSENRQILAQVIADAGRITPRC